MGTEVQVVDEKPGNLVNYDPEFAKQNVSKINALANYAIKVKDEKLMADAAEAKEKEITQLVKWWKGVVQENTVGLVHQNSGARETISADEAWKVCGFRQQRISEWSKALETGEYAEHLLEEWKKRAGLIETERAGGGGGGGGGSTSTLDKILKLIPSATGPELEIIEREVHQLRINLGLIPNEAKVEKKAKQLPKPDYVEDDFTGIVEKPADYRVTKAVHAFFNDVPGNKRVWVQQRMEEQPSPMKAEGVHIDWIKAFWGSDPEVQSAIREEIKIENMRRMEG